MISNKDFNCFLRQGFINGLQNGTSMNRLIEEFGQDNWYVKNLENNGLTYGIMKVGITEFHIYDEMVSGIRYRPDILFSEEDYSDVTAPWIIEQNDLTQIELKLDEEKIKFKKYEVQGPLKNLDTAGAQLFSLEEGSHTFIDTEGGVTFLFESEGEKFLAYQICKYYKNA
jgi:hypothetical protein